MAASTQIATHTFTSLPTAAPAAPATSKESRYMLQTVPKSIWIQDVCGLIDAAGPLTVNEIAGGLNAPMAQVATVVEFLMGNASLQIDEWSRLKLAGECRDRA